MAVYSTWLRLKLSDVKNWKQKFLVNVLLKAGFKQFVKIEVQLLRVDLRDEACQNRFQRRVRLKLKILYLKFHPFD